MIDYLSIVRSLLPSGKAFASYGEKINRKFYKSLFSWLPDSLDAERSAIQNFYPQTTQDLDKFEDQFGLISGDKTEQERRDQLAAAWRGVVGGQDKIYLNGVLKQAGFDLYVHEPYDPTDPNYPPSFRNPFEYINLGDDFLSCGQDEAYCGNPNMMCGGQIEKYGYLLVNNINQIIKKYNFVCGGNESYCGNPEMNSGSYASFLNIKVKYEINPDPATFPFYIYICGKNFPDVVEVPKDRRDTLETLLFKHMPAQKWLGVLVKYI